MHAYIQTHIQAPSHIEAFLSGLFKSTHSGSRCVTVRCSYSTGD